MAAAASAAFVNRCEQFARAATNLLMVPELSDTERDVILNARKTVRRSLAMREATAAGRAPTDAELDEAAL